MSRDQRVKDNWALLHACEVAADSGAPVAICFNLVRPCPALLGHLCAGFAIKPAACLLV